MGKPTIRPYQNPYELSFRQWAEGQGWEVSKSGWPDFLCRRGQEVMAVEVKGGSDTLSAEQRRTIANLRQAGMPTFVWSPEFGLSDDAAPVSESPLSLMAEITRLRTLISEMIALRNEPPWKPPTWVDDLAEKVQVVNRNCRKTHPEHQTGNDLWQCAYIAILEARGSGFAEIASLTGVREDRVARRIHLINMRYRIWKDSRVAS